MSVRIGRQIIMTGDWNSEDYSVVIRALHEERAHVLKAEELKERMTDLLNEAKENGYDFIDKDIGNVIRPEDVTLYENP